MAPPNASKHALTGPPAQRPRSATAPSLPTAVTGKAIEEYAQKQSTAPSRPIDIPGIPKQYQRQTLINSVPVVPRQPTRTISRVVKADEARSRIEEALDHSRQESPLFVSHSPEAEPLSIQDVDRHHTELERLRAWGRATKFNEPKPGAVRPTATKLGTVKVSTAHSSTSESSAAGPSTVKPQSAKTPASEDHDAASKPEKARTTTGYGSLSESKSSSQQIPQPPEPSTPALDAGRAGTLSPLDFSRREIPRDQGRRVSALTNMIQESGENSAKAERHFAKAQQSGAVISRATAVGSMIPRPKGQSDNTRRDERPRRHRDDGEDFRPKLRNSWDDYNGPIDLDGWLEQRESALREAESLQNSPRYDAEDQDLKTNLNLMLIVMRNNRHPFKEIRASINNRYERDYSERTLAWRYNKLIKSKWHPPASFGSDVRLEGLYRFNQIKPTTRKTLYDRSAYDADHHGRTKHRRRPTHLPGTPRQAGMPRAEYSEESQSSSGSSGGMKLLEPTVRKDRQITYPGDAVDRVIGPVERTTAAGESAKGDVEDDEFPFLMDDTGAPSHQQAHSGGSRPTTGGKTVAQPGQRTHVHLLKWYDDATEPASDAAGGADDASDEDEEVQRTITYPPVDEEPTYYIYTVHRIELAADSSNEDDEAKEILVGTFTDKAAANAAALQGLATLSPDSTFRHGDDARHSVQQSVDAAGLVVCVYENAWGHIRTWVSRALHHRLDAAPPSLLLSAPSIQAKVYTISECTKTLDAVGDVWTEGATTEDPVVYVDLGLANKLAGDRVLVLREKSARIRNLDDLSLARAAWREEMKEKLELVGRMGEMFHESMEVGAGKVVEVWVVERAVRGPRN